MAFYGQRYQDVLTLPIDTFWLLNRNIDRLEATQDMRHLHGSTMAQCPGQDAFKQYEKKLELRIGNLSIIDEPLDREGLKRLKAMSG